MLLSTCTLSGQQKSKELLSSEKKIESELLVILDSIVSKYDSQDFVSTVNLSEKGRTLSNTVKFYDYYTRISSYLGNALIQNGDTLQAVDIFVKSLEKAHDFQNSDVSKVRKNIVLTTANIDLANVNALTGNFTAAIDKYKEALISADQSYPDGLFIINYNIAESYLELQKPQQAYPYIEEAKRLLQFIEEKAYIASYQLLSGKYYFLISDFKEALKHLDESIKLAQEKNFREVLVEAYKFSSKTEAELGNFKRAYDIGLTLDVLEKEIYDSDRIRAVQNTTAKFKYDEMIRNMDAEIISRALKADYRREQAVKENTIIWSSIALIISIGLIVILLVGFLRRKKLNKDLAEKNLIYLEEKRKSDKLLTARNALFSRISHELRTPMYGIVGISNILMEDNAIPKIHNENIRSLKYSADYLLSLINNVLEMNKLNRSTYLTLAQEVFDIRELCHHAIESAKYISLDHTNTFLIHIDADVSKLYEGDAVKLMQVLINLLGNSNKFTKNGTISINVHKRRSEVEKDMLEFIIKDNGKGIANSKLKNIFDETKFINHNEQYEGTGLGLPISKKILELQNSDLTLISEEGIGTTVKFMLNFKPIQNDSRDLKSIKHEDLLKDLTGKRILIVEDNKVNQLVTKKIIEGFNGSYEIADSGRQAIDMARDNDYDLILMDINMPPGIDGFEATSEIRLFNSSVPIIALTAVEQIEIEKRLQNSLMNDYLIKPFKSEELLKKIASFLT